MRKIKFLGVPFHFGQSHHGVACASEVLRTMGFLNRLAAIAPVVDVGTLDFSLIKPSTNHPLIKNYSQVCLANELVSQCLEREKLNDHFLLNVGGDHGMALGTIHGILCQRPETVVVWADAHGDINLPESSPSGNFHGMPLAFLMGMAKDQGLDWIKVNLLPEKLIFFGPRDLDAQEKEFIQNLNIQYFSSEEINRLGAETILQRALLKADPEGVCPIHLSFDVDIFDACDVTATGTRVPAGPQKRQVMEMGEILGETGRLRSMDLVELNPDLGCELEVQRTFALAQQFVCDTIKAAFRRRMVSYLSSPAMEAQPHSA